MFIIGKYNTFLFILLHELIHYMTHSKCDFQYFDAQFTVVALVKKRKMHNLSNANNGLWSCSIRWCQRSRLECYLTHGWKQFCVDNRLKA